MNVDLKLKDVTIETYSTGSGPFDPNSPAVRITHKASGKSVSCHDYGERQKNVDFCSALLFLFVKHGIEPTDVRDAI